MTDLPATSLVRRAATHRLIPTRYTDRRAVLSRIADDDRHLAAIEELAAATDDQALAENQLLPGIGVHELVFGVPYAHIVNATFTHAHPLGGRFNGPDRGAWYAAFEVTTSQAEVAFHRAVQLAEINRFEDEVSFDDYLADFSAEFHELRNAPAFAACLDPDSYLASQALAERLLDRGALGVIYPSVRRPRGTCLACFRPALVTNVRPGSTYDFRWTGSATPAITRRGSRAAAGWLSLRDRRASGEPQRLPGPVRK